MSTFTTWLFAGTGVALGAALPALVARGWGLVRTAGARLVQRLQPAERYDSLGLANWAVGVIGQRDDPDDPVVLKVSGGRGYSLVQSIKRTGLVEEPLTREQQQAVQAATRDYGPGGPGYWRRHLPEWTRRELVLARLFLLDNGSERCMVYGGTIPNSTWVAVCARPRWHRGAHLWQRFSTGTLTAQDPGPSDD
jgi:hypothetical protein